MKIKYHGIEVEQHRLDILVENVIIIELKAVKEFAGIHFAQLRSYLNYRLKSWFVAQFWQTHFRNKTGG